MSEHAEHSHHVQPKALYVKTFGFLFVMMVLTIAAAYLPEWVPAMQGRAWGSWANNLIALMIATSKAIAVVAIFMGVKFATNLTKIFAILGFAWFSLMFIMFCDYATRDWEPVRGWEETPGHALPRGPAADPVDEAAAETRDFDGVSPPPPSR